MSLQEQSNKWFALGNSWSLSRSTFCCFNAFAGVDVRVEARIPGGVKSFVIDALGCRHGTEPETWNEVFLCSVLRSIFQATQKCTGKRTLSALLSPKTEMKFLALATRLFESGWKLGSPDGPSLASPANNYLTRGVVEYFCGTRRPEIAIGFLKQHISDHPCLSGLLFECFLLAGTHKNKTTFFIYFLDQQGLAIDVATNVTADSSCYGALADFLISRSNWGEAVVFAEEALKRDPLNFSSWLRLAKIKADKGAIEEAFKLLNNASRIEYPEINYEAKGRPTPAAISIPIDEEQKLLHLERQEATSAIFNILSKLKGDKLTGIDAQVYALLVQIVNKHGWDTLLQARSNLFLLEEEFAPSNGQPKRQKATNYEEVEFDEKAILDAHNPTSPIIAPSPRLEAVEAVDLAATKKKICEKWFDRLFLVLFEDLRVFEVFAQELAEKRVTNLKTGQEWYLLGKLCLRLGKLAVMKMIKRRLCLFHFFVGSRVYFTTSSQF